MQFSLPFPGAPKPVLKPLTAHEKSARDRLVQSAPPGPEEVRWLFLDLNSFFASCEQQHNPALRGKPIAVVQMMTDSTCAIAASYEAKKFGIKTGTAIYEAKKLCPDLRLVQANHKRYVTYHHKVLEAIGRHMPIEKICSIDEVACRLTGDQCDVKIAAALAQRIKDDIRANVGACLTSSIGLAPNSFLAKLGTDMQKPDGLVIIRCRDLPDAILHLEPGDLPGVGWRMEERLAKNRVHTMEDLCRLDMAAMRNIWGGVEGERLYLRLRGEEPTLRPTRTSCIGHQHVLEPELRNRKGLQIFARHLLTKAAERLRAQNYYCRHMILTVRWTGEDGKSYRDFRFAETQDTLALLRMLDRQLHSLPARKPLRVGIMLADLVPSSSHQHQIFGTARPSRLSGALDRLNHKYGRGTVHFGEVPDSVRRFTGFAAFQRVPGLEEFDRD